MSRRGVYDNWQRLYEAVRKREDLRRLSLCPSISSSSSSNSSSRSSFDSADVDGTLNNYCNGDGLSRISSVGDSSFPAGQRDAWCLLGEILPNSSLKTYSFADLENATGNFESEMVVGEGGLGIVYKGWVDEETLMPSEFGSGMMVAVKKRKAEAYHGLEECQSMVNVLGKLLHPNLVKLLGYCSEDQELLLVYEFMTKGNLANHLFKKNSYSEPLSWNIRLEIATGAAKGLAFLHTPIMQVIYRDFNSTNILLDGNYNAKLTNSALAILGPSEGESYVETLVMGTYGYAAPEYIATGYLYVKSDVYGFGVVLLEMLTGLRAIDRSRPKGQTKLVDWMKPLLGQRKKLKSVMDAEIEGQYTSKAALQASKLALRCLKPDHSSRPSMEEVLEILQQISAIEKPKGSKTSRRFML